MYESDAFQSSRHPIPLLVPGKDKCPKCGADPLFYNSSQADRHSIHVAVCSVCKTPAYKLNVMASSNKVDFINDKSSVRCDGRETTPDGIDQYNEFDLKSTRSEPWK
jgi:transcription elongation factor Elf1